MPACALSGEDETLNLSFLASEEAWNSLRDVANDGRDTRRTNPRFLWLGALPCACVTQATAALSLPTAATPGGSG